MLRITSYNVCYTKLLRVVIAGLEFAIFNIPVDATHVAAIEDIGYFDESEQAAMLQIVV